MGRNKDNIAGRHKARILVMMFLIMHVTGIPLINAQVKSTRQSSLDAFAGGDYELAYNGFRELLVTYPKDPLYKYYSGVCLIKLNRDPEEALVFLQQAHQGSAVVRTIPSDALFWLGRAQQLAGRFTEAIASYNEFTGQYGKKAARDLDIPGYIQQCQDRKGQLAEAGSKTGPAEKQSRKTEIVPAITMEQKVDLVPVAGKLQDSIPGNFDRILSEALDYQFKADSLTSLIEEWKGRLEKLDSRGKADLKVRITEADKLAESYQKKADLKYNEAQVSMNSTSFSAVKVADKDTIRAADSTAIKKPVQDLPSARTSISVKKDTATSNTINVYSFFSVKMPETGSETRISVNSAIPPGLIYRIQVAVFRNPVSQSYFKGITPIYGFKVTGTANTAYYAGMFRRIADARKALVTVKQKGFRDAFIVALYGGKPVSIERAAVLEKEWGKKPFITASPSPHTIVDTIPPELCFRVEIARSAKPVKPEVLEEMKKIAGTKGLDIELHEKGPAIYLIGKFITYESAMSYADLLIRNGYKDAKVVARLGEKEVPLEKARELFEKVE